MKTMKCSDMGGSCDMTITAGSWDEMATEGMKHAEASHPELAAKVKAMSPEEMAKWTEEAKAKYDALPEDAQPEVQPVA